MTLKRIIFLLCLFLSGILFTPALYAGVVDIIPSDDAQVVQGDPAANFGTATSIYIASASGGSYQNERGWFKFDLTDQVPPGASIVSAKLRVYCYSADDTQNMATGVQGSNNDSWNETNVTWDNQPSLDTSELDQVELKANENYKWVEWDVTSFVTTEQNGDRIVSLVVKASTEGSDPYETYVFDSKEYSAALAPRLRVEYSGQWSSDNSFKIFHVNDAHSRLVSHEVDIPGSDDVPMFEKVGGASYLATKMIALKTASPDSLILDAGDISEGNPLGDLRTNGGMIDFYNMLDTKLKTLGGRGIDAVVVGNHDVREGEMLTNMENANFPFISMNLYHLTGDEAGTTVFPPHVMVTIDSKKIGILGYTNDSSSYLGPGTEGVVEVKKCVWDDDDPETLNIKDYVETLRTTEGCDVVILLSHIGQTRVVAGNDALIVDDGTVKPPEVVISGHWHSITDTVWQPAQLNGNTIIAEAASYMQYIGELEVTESGKYVQARKHIIKNADIEPDTDVANLIDDLITEYNNTSPAHQLDEIIGYSAVDLYMDKDKWWTLNEYPWNGNNAAGAWITDAMQWKAQQLGVDCDLAIQSGGGIRRDIPAGWITYGQIYEAYPWQDDNMVTITMTGQEIWDALESLHCGASISKGWEVTAEDGIISSLKLNGSDINLEANYQVAVSEYMAEHEDEFSGKSPVEVGYTIRESIVDYTRQFVQGNPLTLEGPRYVLNTEFAGGFNAVVTMLADSESQPYYEAAFVRLISATPETTLRRASYGLNDLVNSDGSINHDNQFSEIMLYRSHLGLRDGYLKPGDVIEIWGEGGFYAGNPQFVDQNGIYGPDTEFNITGNDPTLAEPEYKKSINSFMDDHHENHLVKFYAERTGSNTVEDANGTTLTIYEPGGYYTADLPGNNGDILELIGLNTMRFEERRFRLREAALASDQSINGYPPNSKVNSIETFRQNASPLTLEATASDVVSSGEDTTIAQTSFEEPSLGSKYYDTGDAATDHALVNNAGEMIVNYTSTGGELGFTAYYTNTRDGAGLTDGDYVGVTDYTPESGGSYPEGSQGFELSDPDGKVTVTLDTVDLTETTNPEVSLSLFVKSDSWEADDVIRIWVTVDGGTEIDLLNTTGQDIDSLGIEGSWQTLKADLSGYTQATLSFELDANSSDEAIFIDYIRFQEIGATTSFGDPESVEFFYRYSQDSITWGDWNSAGTSESNPWQVSFSYPEGIGYYEFCSAATDADNNTESLPVRADVRIQYAGGTNEAPDTISDPSIPDGTSDVALVPTLTVTVSDPEYDLVDVYFYDSNDNLISVVYNVATGQTASVVWKNLQAGTTYGWYVIVDDGVSTTQFPLSTFTTQGISSSVLVPATGIAGLIFCILILAAIGLKETYLKNKILNNQKTR